MILLRDWVRKGGALIYCGEDIDLISRCLNGGIPTEINIRLLRNNLFEKLGLGRVPAAGTYPCGKGMVTVIREDPKHFVLKSGNDRQYFDAVSVAYRKSAGKEVELKNSFLLERGPYTIAAVLDESVSDAPMELRGCISTCLIKIFRY